MSTPDPAATSTQKRRDPMTDQPTDDVTMPLALDRVQAIVEHLLMDGSRMGLILGDELNTAMGASARRRAARAALAVVREYEAKS